MKIISWNVNGIRAVINKGFLDFVKNEDPDILCLQETKAFESQVPAEMRFAMQDYDFVWHQGTRPGYAGTATFYKKSLNFVDKNSNFAEVEKFNDDGRVVELRFGLDGDGSKPLLNPPLIKGGLPSGKKNDIQMNIGGQREVVLLNIYFPNGGTRADGQEMLTYKLEFFDHYLDYIQKLEKEGKLVITCGDFNICHREIDIARPEANKNSIGFLPVEREKIGSIFESGFVDVFRYFNPDLADHYTRWSYRAGARPRNVGRRLDYFVVSEGLIGVVKSMKHLDQVLGSDHCPIVMEI